MSTQELLLLLNLVVLYGHLHIPGG